MGGVGGGREAQKQRLQLESCSVWARTEEGMGRRHIRTISRVKCGLFCGSQSWADRIGVSWDPAARRHVALREGIKSMGGSWRSLPGDRTDEGGDKGHDEGPEEQQWPEPCPSQASELSQTKPDGLLHLHEPQKNLTKSSKPEGSHSHFGNAKESNSQWSVCNPSTTFVVAVFGFTYTVISKNLRSKVGELHGRVRREEREKGNEVIIL